MVIITIIIIIIIMRYCGFTRLMGSLLVLYKAVLTFGCDIELTLGVLVTVC